MKKQIRGSLLLLLTAMIWGSAFVAQKKGMDYVGPFTYCGIRMLIGSAVLIPVILVQDHFRSEDEKRKMKLNQKSLLTGGLFCGLFLFGGSIFQQIGLQYTTAGKGGFITALYIILVPLFGLFLHKKVSNLAWISVVVAVIGFYLLCIKEDFSIGYGDMMVLICAVLFSGHILVVDYFSPRVDGVRLSSIQFLVCGVISCILMFFFETPSWSAIWDAKECILYAGVLSSGVAYTLQIIAQKDVAPVVATLLMSLESVFSALAGWLILKDQMTVREFLGCAIVFAAVILAQMPESSGKL
ncbi:MAG: DMT family transporter [Lachnospiraceae bacterium]|nr:DMT family transporter [Lachnospiraceae bacterium]